MALSNQYALRDDLTILALLDAASEALEFISTFSDVTDGPYGQPEPNRAMIIENQLEWAIAQCERAQSKREE